MFYCFENIMLNIKFCLTLWCSVFIKKFLKIPKVKLEVVIRKRTDPSMTKRKRDEKTKVVIRKGTDKSITKRKRDEKTTMMHMID